MPGLKCRLLVLTLLSVCVPGHVQAGGVKRWRGQIPLTFDHPYPPFAPGLPSHCAIPSPDLRRTSARNGSSWLHPSGVSQSKGGSILTSATLLPGGCVYDAGREVQRNLVPLPETLRALCNKFGADRAYGDVGPCARYTSV
eukprot:2776395-Rhodomonas_salina.1